MTKSAAQTAYGPISIVAAEQARPAAQRLVQDDLARRFLPPMLKLLYPLHDLLYTASEQRSPGVWGGVLCRKRYIDDQLQSAIGAGFQDFVILGAGLDTRPYRFPSLAESHVYEIDLPENIRYKRAMLVRLFGSVPAHVTLAGVDLEQDDLPGVLAALGYAPAGKTFFIWEGVTQYLTIDAVQRTMNFLSQADPGSRLVFTFIRQDFIDGTNLHGQDILYHVYRGNPPVWHFGLDPRRLADFLEAFGWKEIEQVGSREYAARYLTPLKRNLSVMQVEITALAEKI